ncbi:MAG: hypothetical protein ACHQZQ_02240 [SAR324 cluster bacterium]
MNRHAGWKTGIMLLAVLGLVASARAQSISDLFRKDGAASPPPSKPDYASMAQGDSFTSSHGVTFVVLPELRAVERPPAGALTQQVVERKGAFQIYRQAALGSQSKRLAVATESMGEQSLTTYAVVLNRRTGGLGIVLGRIVVTLADIAQSDAVAAAYGLTVATRYDENKIVIYGTAPGQDLGALTDALRADARVLSADPEILEYLRTPK